MGKSDFFLLLGFLAIIIFVVSRVRSKQKNTEVRYSRTPLPNREPGEHNVPPIAEKPDITPWFRERLAEFSKKSLAYFVYQEAMDADVPVQTMEDLLEKYGKYMIKPSLISFLSDVQRSGGSFSQVGKAAELFLQEKGINAPAGSWEKVIEEYVWDESRNKAKKIIDSIKNN